MISNLREVGRHSSAPASYGRRRAGHGPGAGPLPRARGPRARLGRRRGRRPSSSTGRAVPRPRRVAASPRFDVFRPFRDGPAFMLPVVAHAQVGGALHVLPSRAVDYLLAAQLIVHRGAAALGLPQAVLLDGVRVRTDATPVVSSPLAVDKFLTQVMLSVPQRETERRVRR